MNAKLIKFENFHSSEEQIIRKPKLIADGTLNKCINKMFKLAIVNTQFSVITPTNAYYLQFQNQKIVIYNTTSEPVTIATISKDKIMNLGENLSLNDIDFIVLVARKFFELT